MTAIRSVGKRSLGSDDDGSESLLQHSYFIAAIVIVLALVILRFVVLRWRNQSASDFFRIRSSARQPYGSPPPNDSSYRSMYHGLQLAPPPAAYQPERRVRAADTDTQGRRLGPVGENWDGKDALPPYDNLDRPPKYVEASWSYVGSPHSTGQSTVTPSPEGEPSRVTHPNTTSGDSGDSVDQPFVDAHAATRPPTHHDLPSS